MNKSKLTSVAMLLGCMAVAGAAFPVTLEIHNSVWRSLVEPESGREVPGAVDGVPGAASFELRNEDQFVRILSNVEQINFINGFADGDGLSIVFPGVPVDITDEGGKAGGHGADSGVGSLVDSGATGGTTEVQAPPAADPPAPAVLTPAPIATASTTGNKPNRGGSR